MNDPEPCCSSGREGQGQKSGLNPVHLAALSSK